MLLAVVKTDCDSILKLNKLSIDDVLIFIGKFSKFN